MRKGRPCGVPFLRLSGGLCMLPQNLLAASGETGQAISLALAKQQNEKPERSIGSLSSAA